jgi:hypothetical protein
MLDKEQCRSMLTRTRQDLGSLSGENFSFFVMVQGLEELGGVVVEYVCMFSDVWSLLNLMVCSKRIQKSVSSAAFKLVTNRVSPKHTKTIPPKPQFSNTSSTTRSCC